MSPGSEEPNERGNAALAALRARSDLGVFGDVRLGLFAIELHLDIDDIAAVASVAVTDGPGDKKCDILHIDRETGIAVIAQVYFSELPDDREAPANKASDLNTAVAWILGDGGPESMASTLVSASQALKDALEHGDVQVIELWYVHNLAASLNVERELTQATLTARALLRSIDGAEDVEVRALEVDLSRLGDWYASTQTAIQVEDDISVPAVGWYETHGADWRAVCSSVPASWLREMALEHGDKLFSANIRAYMPSRRTTRNINYNIERTATEDGSNFWAFNNGVTALVHAFDTTGGRLEISGLAIVNGAQTTGAIAKAGDGLDAGAEVLVRFVECSDDALIEQIIRFNNSQNPIKASDFRSMDAHQDRLRAEFESIPDSTYLGARRGGEADRARRPSNLVSSDTAAQAIACFQGDPGTAYHSLRSIWERDDVYSTYFSDHTSAKHVVLAYSLMKAVQAQKARLAAIESEALTEGEREQLAFLRMRGAIFLMTAAIAACIETFVGRAVPDRFRVSFGVDTSPADAQEHWAKIVEVSLPFVTQLSPAAESGELRRNDRVDSAIANFRALVESTRDANSTVYETFADAVSLE